MTYREMTEKIISEAFPRGDYEKIIVYTCPQFFFDNARDKCEDGTCDGRCEVCWDEEYKED